MSQQEKPIRISRRVFLGGALAALSVPLMNKLLLSPVYAAPVAGLSQAKQDFTQLSLYLTGHEQLDPALSERYYQTMLQLYPDFTAQVQALQGFITANHIDAADLQKRWMHSSLRWRNCRAASFRRGISGWSARVNRPFVWRMKMR